MRFTGFGIDCGRCVPVFDKFVIFDFAVEMFVFPL